MEPSVYQHPPRPPGSLTRFASRWVEHAWEAERVYDPVTGNLIAERMRERIARPLIEVARIVAATPMVVAMGCVGAIVIAVQLICGVALAIVGLSLIVVWLVFCAGVVGIAGKLAGPWWATGLAVWLTTLTVMWWETAIRDS